MTRIKETTLPEVRDCTATFEQALARTEEDKYILHLYVAGMGPKSVQAVNNIKRICEEYLSGRYQLDVVDVYQYPMFAIDSKIIAAPTLIKELPLPLRKLIGSMSNTERVLAGMDLKNPAR